MISSKRFEDLAVSWPNFSDDRLTSSSIVDYFQSEGADYLTITPPKQLRSATIDTYGDHRMAMCFSLAALGGVAITINDPEVVSKTFPDYFAQLDALAQH